MLVVSPRHVPSVAHNRPGTHQCSADVLGIQMQYEGQDNIRQVPWNVRNQGASTRDVGSCRWGYDEVVVVAARDVGTVHQMIAREQLVFQIRTAINRSSHCLHYSGSFNVCGVCVCDVVCVLCMWSSTFVGVQQVAS